MNGQETEVKFYVRNLKRLEAQLLELGARLEKARVHETNLRFDLPDGSLHAGQRVLRLRHADDDRLTYKGKSKRTEGVLSRAEIEFTVGDYEAARQFIEALGYVQVAFYEKYRTTYTIDKTHFMLDELPYGDFVEIEGESIETIRAAASRLSLDWEAAVPNGYLALFERICADTSTTPSTSLGLDPTQLTFAALNDFRPSEQQLAIRAADQPVDE